MARRMIECKTWQSFQVGQLDYRQRCLWIGIITVADDQGRGRAHPGILRGALFPYDEIGLDEIQADLDYLASLGLVHLYQNNDGAPLYQIINWWRYQRPTWAWPSDLPAPTGWSDREKYRQGNEVIESGWDDDGGFTIDPDGPTVTPPRPHDDPTVSKAPSTSGSTSDSIRDRDMGADAPTEPQTSERQPSQKDQIRKALELHFADVTGLPRPKTNTQKQKRAAGTLWWGPLREIAELCEWNEKRAKTLVSLTVNHLREGDCTIASPKSIEKTARAVYTGNAPGVAMPQSEPPAKRTVTVENPDGSTEEVEVYA